MKKEKQIKPGSAKLQGNSEYEHITFHLGIGHTSTLIKTKDCDGNCAVGLYCYHWIKEERKQSCQKMVEYMEKEIVNKYGFVGDHPALEAAKEYLKTL